MNYLSGTGASGTVRLTSIDDRRRSKRRPVVSEAVVVVLDGPRADERFDTNIREVSETELSFLLRAEVRVGQTVRIDSMHDGRPTGHRRVAEVVRSRLLSNGKWEVAAEIRRAPQQPKPSESQRRHERRRERMARLGIPVA